VLSAGQSKTARSESEKIKVKSARPKGAATEHRLRARILHDTTTSLAERKVVACRRQFLVVPTWKKGEHYEGLCSWVCGCQDLVVTG
jgi:hypothetical protein